jgi:hypothetical protein
MWISYVILAWGIGNLLAVFIIDPAGFCEVLREVGGRWRDFIEHDVLKKPYPKVSYREFLVPGLARLYYTAVGAEKQEGFDAED